jgi:hypothetical protein
MGPLPRIRIFLRSSRLGIQLVRVARIKMQRGYREVQTAEDFG